MPDMSVEGHQFRTITEQTSTNPRLAGKARGRFIGFMKKLNFPTPGRTAGAKAMTMCAGKADG
jgi:hypothetical protein